MPKRRVLVVEDTDMNLELIGDLLEVGGYQVLKATTAAEGLALARSEAPDLILMDISLPDMDGLEATRRLKQEESTRHIPVAALTAHATAEDEARSIAAGCAAHLTKPIDTRTLPQVVARLIEAQHP